jgi:hypothetical protein
MGKGLVGLGHAMHVLALLDRIAFVARRVEDLGGQLVDHRLLAAPARVADQPAEGERGAPRGVDLDRDLIGGPADALRLDLDARLEVLDRLLEDLERIFLGPLLDLVEGAVEDLLGRRLLAVPHHGVDELGDKRAVVDRVGQNLPFGDLSSSRHSVPTVSPGET